MTNVRIYRTVVGEDGASPVQTGTTKVRVYQTNVGSNTSIPPILTMPSAISVEAGGLINLTVVESGQISSREWKMNGTVVGSAATLKVNAPVPTSDTNYVYTYTVTNSDGISASGTVNVAVLQAMNWTIDSSRNKIGYVLRTYTQAELDAFGQTNPTNPVDPTVPDPVTPEIPGETINSPDVRIAPFSINQPGFTSGTSSYTVNPDRTTL